MRHKPTGYGNGQLNVMGANHQHLAMIPHSRFVLSPPIPLASGLTIG